MVQLTRPHGRGEHLKTGIGFSRIFVIVVGFALVALHWHLSGGKFLLSDVTTPDLDLSVTWYVGAIGLLLIVCGFTSWGYEAYGRTTVQIEENQNDVAIRAINNAKNADQLRERNS